MTENIHVLTISKHKKSVARKCVPEVFDGEIDGKQLYQKCCIEPWSV